MGLTSASPRSSIHSLRIRMMSYPCNKYEQITASYPFIDKYIIRCPLVKKRLIFLSVFKVLDEPLGESNMERRAKIPASIPKEDT